MITYCSSSRSSNFKKYLESLPWHFHVNLKFTDLLLPLYFIICKVVLSFLYQDIEKKLRRIFYTNLHRTHYSCIKTAFICSASKVQLKKIACSIRKFQNLFSFAYANTLAFEKAAWHSYMFLALYLNTVLFTILTDSSCCLGSHSLLETAIKTRQSCRCFYCRYCNF